MSETKTAQLFTIAARKGFIRPKDVLPQGIAREHFKRLVEAGKLERIDRGLYRPAGLPPTENHDLAVVCSRAPEAVVCLLSALRFHDMGTQIPHSVWIAVPSTAGTPRLVHPPIRVFHVAQRMLTTGIEEHDIEGVNVRITNPTKTVADCFKFRNRIGTEAVVEALRAWREKRMGTMDDLWRYAKVCRVANIMRPYLEMLS